MIALVTVDVVITGIIIMKTCLFFIIAVFINVIINDVIVFGYVFSLNQSESLSLRRFFFLVWKMHFLFDLFFVVVAVNLPTVSRGGDVISPSKLQTSISVILFHLAG